MNIKKRVDYTIEGLSKNELQKIYDALGFVLDVGGFTTETEKKEVKDLIDAIGTILSI